MTSRVPEAPQQLVKGEQTKQWQVSFIMLALFFIVWCLVYWSTLVSMFDLWLNNNAYTHGFFILPISAWLIWRERFSLQRLTPQPWWFGSVVVFGLSLIWLLGDLVGIQAAQHLAIAGMLPAAVLSVMGRSIFKSIAFPLLFLIFLAPVGEFLVPTLMEITAWFTVGLLKLVGMPVLQEGLLITIPSGLFEVASACSGIRYLIATVVAGSLYAYLTYRSVWRIVLFILLSALVPIVANGLRAFGIVMLAHYSDHTLAVGFDHLIYGWVFFGVVMFVLLWAGSLWKEPVVALNQLDGMEVSVGKGCSAPFLFSALLFVALFSGQFVHILVSFSIPRSYSSNILPVGDDRLIRLSAASTDWSPFYQGAVDSRLASYKDEVRSFSMFVAVYSNQKQGAEMVGGGNFPYSVERWQLVGTAVLKSNEVAYAELHLQRANNKRIIGYWYRVGGKTIVRPSLVKIHEIWDKLTGRNQSAVVAVALDYEGEIEPARQSLKKIVSHMAPVTHEKID